jgi:hypothetical protein
MINKIKKTSKKIFVKIISLLLMLFVILLAIYLVLVANGYKINYQTRSIQKTGMIYVKSDPTNVDIFINNRLVANQSPYRMLELLPGRYDVLIEKLDYYSWTKSVNVNEGMASAFENVELFLRLPEQLVVSDQEKSDFPNLVNNWQTKGLEIKNDNEIWFNDVYITRFSSDVKKVGWYSDLKHIIFQTNMGLYIMDPDGSNNIQLATLNSDQACSFVVINNGKEILYSDDGNIYKIKVQ